MNPPPGRPMTLAEIADDETVATFRTEADIAKELRDELAEPLAAICRVMDKARASGLKVDFSIQSDAFGRFVPPYVMITKSL